MTIEKFKIYGKVTILHKGESFEDRYLEVAYTECTIIYKNNGLYDYYFREGSEDFSAKRWSSIQRRYIYWWNPEQPTYNKGGHKAWHDYGWLNSCKTTATPRQLEMYVRLKYRDDVNEISIRNS